MNKAKRFEAVESRDKALAVASWLDEKKGEDILVLDVRGLSQVTDYVVVVTAHGARQAQALADHMLAQLRDRNYEFLAMEGYQNGQWILVDANDVVAHIFQDDSRRLYNLEGLWTGAKSVPFKPAAGRPGLAGQGGGAPEGDRS